MARLPFIEVCPFWTGFLSLSAGSVAKPVRPSQLALGWSIYWFVLGQLKFESSAEHGVRNSSADYEGHDPLINAPSYVRPDDTDP